MSLLPVLLQMDEFMELGNEVQDGELDALIESQKPNQCCVLIYTSGTTGKPKGVMLNHDNVCIPGTHLSMGWPMVGKCCLVFSFK